MFVGIDKRAIRRELQAYWQTREGVRLASAITRLEAALSTWQGRLIELCDLQLHHIAPDNGYNGYRKASPAGRGLAREGGARAVAHVAKPRGAAPVTATSVAEAAQVEASNRIESNPIQSNPI